jgi:hypothetical protein
VNKNDKLAKAYSTFIEVPWSANAAPAQRVIFCVYDEEDERKLRFGMESFRSATREAGHGWEEYDLTDSFAGWLSGHPYAEEYFLEPEYLETVLNGYLDYIVDGFTAFIGEKAPDAGTVVALTGVGSLFGFLKVNAVVEKLAPLVAGRLLVFFPGSCNDNNYRLLDAYDGWNYHAVPIIAGKEY